MSSSKSLPFSSIIATYFLDNELTNKTFIEGYFCFIYINIRAKYYVFIVK